MIKSFNEFFNRLKAVMKDDFYIEEQDPNSKEYLEKSKNPKYKIKTGLMIDLVPLPDEIENSFQHEE
tara:strand:+ start:1045 stop:1245 length:201 start_codon:yes stop_codon:yes gene_type:complete